MNQMPKTVPVAVVIPAHRRIDKLLRTLERVQACDPAPETVTVHVDGGSEEVCEAVRSRFPEVQVMTSEVLLGPGGARDKMIRQSRHEWVATFDDDSYPEAPDFFAHAMEDARRFPDAAVLSWDTLSEEKAARGFHHIAVFSGCGSVFSRSWYLRTRGFLPRVVAYGFEEVDVSLQLHCLGGRILYDPRLRVVHDHPMTEGVPLETMAGAVVNAFLFPVARFPLLLLPAGLFAALRYGLRVWRHGGGSAVREALWRLPDEIRAIMPKRAAQPFFGTLSWLRLRHQPQHLHSPRSRLARLLYPYGAVRRVLLGPAAGLRFHAAPGIGAMYALGRDHGRALKMMTAFLKQGGVVYDVGANQGQFTLPLARCVGPAGLLLAVEPLPANQAALAANLALGEFPQVTLVRVALSATGGEKAFLFDPDRNTMGTFTESSVKLDGSAASQMVSTLTLDELAARHGRRPDCIKIDVEGAADEVLAGAAETIKAARPAMLVELHLSERHDRERQALIEVARKWNYSITMFDGLPVEAERCPGEYQAWCQPASPTP